MNDPLILLLLFPSFYEKSSRIWSVENEHPKEKAQHDVHKPFGQPTGNTYRNINKSQKQLSWMNHTVNIWSIELTTFQYSTIIQRRTSHLQSFPLKPVPSMLFQCTCGYRPPGHAWPQWISDGSNWLVRGSPCGSRVAALTLTVWSRKINPLDRSWTAWNIGKPKAMKSRKSAWTNKRLHGGSLGWGRQELQPNNMGWKSQ